MDMPKRLNIVGEKFGRLTAIKDIGNYHHDSYWLCRCSCGKFTRVSGGSLRRGTTKSCGCYSKDNPTQRTHGMSRTRFHNTWKAINRRTRGKNYPEYRYYSGRGIKSFWNTFESFRDDMHKSYLKHCKKHGELETTIERIDTNGHYCKENCRWATRQEQNENKRNLYHLTFDGRTQVASEWARELGIKPKTLHFRLRKGWPVEVALTKPLRKWPGKY